MTQSIDILLINPGDRKQIYQALGDEYCAIEPPVFPGLFASYLRRQGLGVDIIDAPAEELSAAMVASRAVKDYKAKLVVVVVYGFQPSASTQNMTAAGAIVRDIKNLDPEAMVMMTGTHPAALPKRTMIEEAVDFVCDLEGPVTIYKTLQALEALQGDFANVPSLWWRDGDVIMAPASAEGLITNLDEEMPGVAWDLMDMSRYRAHNWHCFDDIDSRAPYAAMHTSLGCPYHCSFCCINAPFGKSSYRMWSPESVVDEIGFLVENHNVRHIKFVDEMFVLNDRHVLGICDLIAERGYDVNIWAYARVDTIKAEQLERMRRGGIRWLALGIESGSKHVRDGSSKALKNEDITGIVRTIQDAGIYVLGNYIFGLPDDTAETMRETLDLAKGLNCEWGNFYSAMAYPGSQLYDLAIEKGWELPSSWSGFSQHSVDCLPLPTEALSATAVLQFRDDAFHEYFENMTYLDMIERKFGAATRKHVVGMTGQRLQRQFLQKVS